MCCEMEMTMDATCRYGVPVQKHAEPKREPMTMVEALIVATARRIEASDAAEDRAKCVETLLDVLKEIGRI